MRKYHRNLFIILILLLDIELIACIVNRPAKPDPSTVRVCDTTNIAIDPRISRDFPCIDSLLRSWISDKKGLFQRPDLRAFFASERTRIFISSKEFRSDTSAISYRAKIDPDRTFRDTIFLNNTLFIKR